MTRKVLAGILVVAAMAGLASGEVRAACALTRYASVDIEVNPNGGVLVPVQINGHDVWMALSMSAGIPMIGPAALAPLQLKTAPVLDRNIVSNGVKVKQQVRADSLRVGGADFTDWTLYVQPDQARPLNMYRGKPLVGALSSVFMNAVDMELDLAGRKMNLFKHASCKGEQVYWGGQVTTVKLYSDPSGLLFFPMELDGKQVETSLNTVGRRTRLDERITRDYFGFYIGSPGIATEILPGTNGTVGVKPMSLSAKELAVSGLPVTIVGKDNRGLTCVPTRHGESGAIGFQNCYGLVPLELGTDVLAQLRFYIASMEKRIYFTLAAKNAPAAATGQNAAAGPGVPADGAAQPGAAPPAAGAAAATPAGGAAPTR